MPETRSAPADQAASDDLISFLKASPDGRYRRGVRYLQCPATRGRARDPVSLPK